MKTYSYTGKKLYDTYKQIGEKSYQEMIRFYQKHEHHFDSLEPEQKDRICLDYAISLFKTGAFNEYLTEAQDMIQLVMDRNIYIHRGRNIYNDLIFYMSISLKETNQEDRAFHLAKTLIRLDGSNQSYKRLFYRLAVSHNKNQTNNLGAIVVFLILSLALILLIELLVINSFFQDQKSTFVFIRTALALLAGSIVLVRELYSIIYAVKKHKSICK